LGSSFTDPPVSYAATVPGPRGAAIAFVAETIISFGLMAVVLLFSSISRLARFTGLAAGCLVALYISVESPLSGMSMNPARTFASAAPGMNWQHFWVYLVAPILGMFLAAQLHLALLGARAEHCAKLLHPDDVRCIHCGYKPNSILDTASKPSDLRSLHT
jgi:aquaporin Z